MSKQAFKMHLHPGQSEEYKRRHDALWPELADLLRSTGIRNYSIFLDEETNTLFGVLDIDDTATLDELPKHPVMQRWWAYMSDIMAANPDNSPVSTPLKEVFYLP
ncbi:MAG: L-rhamnose mutarotase [Saprospiraceae bacterium]|nr:L-rhamnose mutarotase [Saprospiraceae bacterium]